MTKSFPARHFSLDSDERLKSMTSHAAAALAEQIEAASSSKHASTRRGEQDEEHRRTHEQPSVNVVDTVARMIPWESRAQLATSHGLNGQSTQLTLVQLF